MTCVVLVVAALFSGWTPTHGVPVPEGSKTKQLKASKALTPVPLTVEQINAAIDAIAKEHGVEIGWDEGGEAGPIGWKKATPAQVESFLPVLREALSNYPKGVFAKERFAAVLLASDLTNAGEHVNG